MKQFLCLEVDGKTPIPMGAYIVTTKYVARADSAFGAVGDTYKCPPGEQTFR